MRENGADMNVTRLFQITKPVRSILCAVVCAILSHFPAEATQRVAVFAFEIQHGDLVQGAPDHRTAEEKRLIMISERLREHLAASGLSMVDIGPVAEKAAATNLRSCSACADGWAQELGADYAITGVVNKVSELILSMNVRVHDAATATPLTSAAVDFRGNTDESWRRAIDYLYKNLLWPRLEKLKK